MTQQETSQAASLPKRRFLPLLLVLFVGSGCSALIYEIVWFQLLQLVIGSSAVSLGVLLGTYMGGMCIGSLALPRWISVRQHPLRVYAFIELGIGIIGAAALFGLPYVAGLYSAHVGHGLGGILLRGVVCAVCLLPPTVLMGATLPAIARWIGSTRQEVSWLGFFYGGNIAGAVFGCLLAGFYLLRVYDMAVATFVAAALNGTVALIALAIARVTPAPTPAIQELNGGQAHGSWPVYITIALSGLCALGAEVIWTRLLSLLLGATVYTFSIILAVFLVGLGIGSGAGSLLSRTTLSPRVALGVCQLLLTVAVAWTAYTLADSLPYWPIDSSLSSSPWLNFQLDLMRCLWAILPAACLWGASFPLALAAVASRGQDPARLVGRVYAANTVGAIIGAIAFSLVLIPSAGTQQSQRLLVALSALAGLLMLARRLWWMEDDRSDAGPQAPGAQIAGAASLVLATGLAAVLTAGIPGVPWELIAYGRQTPKNIGAAWLRYVGEGMNASIAVSEEVDGVRNFHVSGKIEASTVPQDMRLQRMLGHIPALIHPQPRSVLIVGCGAGVTAGTFVLYPSVRRIVICEIEPLIPKVVAHYFSDENSNVVDNPRVQVVYDDARHFILTTPEKFDIITSDPIHPWVKGAATLYSREYFQLCKKHLNPEGLITQWVPLYESNMGAVKSEIATFFDVFPNGVIWSNDARGEGYDIVLLGQAGDTKINIDELQQRLRQADYSKVAESLKDVGFKSALDLFKTYAGQSPDLAPWLKDAEINRDLNLRLQYLAGMALNSDQGDFIYDKMLDYRKFPEDLFVGSGPGEQSLRSALSPSKKPPERSKIPNPRSRKG